MDRRGRSSNDRHFGFVYRVARRLGTPASELDDVCQETFLVAFRKLGDYGEGRFTTWLFRITANLVSERHRKRRVRATLSSWFGLGAGADQLARPILPDAALLAREAEAIVSRVLERMAPKKREVLALFELEGLSGEEIAEHVGCRVETVWTRLHYARKDFERLASKLAGVGR